MDKPIEQFVAEGVTEIIAFVQASERIRVMLVTINQQTTELTELHKLDPELEPELTAVLSHMSDTVDALSRAQKFLSARMNAKLERL